MLHTSHPYDLVQYSVGWIKSQHTELKGNVHLKCAYCHAGKKDGNSWITHTVYEDFPKRCDILKWSPKHGVCTGTQLLLLL